jgi:hypothetical protein
MNTQPIFQHREPQESNGGKEATPRAVAVATAPGNDDAPQERAVRKYEVYVPPKPFLAAAPSPNSPAVGATWANAAAAVVPAPAIFAPLHPVRGVPNGP